MATANLIELQACLDDCLSWCGSHQDQEYVAHFYPQLKRVNSELGRAIKESDAYYLRWKQEERKEKLAWKHLSNELRATQDRLQRLNVNGYPDTRLRHWDSEILSQAVEAMLVFLRERGAIACRDELVEALDRRLATAVSGSQQDRAAYNVYRRHAAHRGQALGAVGAVIHEFRGSMRHHLGKTNPEYQGLRWPWSINPDRSIL